MTSPNLWSYRHFVLARISQDFRARYQNSIFGALWTLLQPLAMITIYTVIFSQIMRAKLPGVEHAFAYSIYLCSGIIAWGLFSEICSRLINVYIENANLLKKIQFPKQCLAVIVSGAAIINFGVIFGLFLGFLIITNGFPGIVFVAVFPVIMTLIFFGVALGLLLATLNVFFRDVGHFFGIFLTFWFWFTPIVYPISIIPEVHHWVFHLNPLFPIMTAIQTILLRAEWPDWHTLIFPFVVAILLSGLAYRLFVRVQSDLVDAL